MDISEKPSMDSAYEKSIIEMITEKANERVSVISGEGIQTSDEASFRLR